MSQYECDALHARALSQGRKIIFLLDNIDQLSETQVRNYIAKHKLII